MRSDIVLLPAWQRPEFLALTLQALRRATHANEHFFVLLLDRGCDAAIFTVIQQYSAGLRLQIVWRHGEHTYPSNNYNVLEGYRYALQLAPQCGAQLVYLVEEDALIRQDMFAFSRLVHTSFAPFAFSAALNLNNTPGEGPIHLPPHADKVYAHPYYQSVCTSMPLRSLASILPHAVAAYYSNPVAYLQRHFPHSRWQRRRCDQDGLIDRIMEVQQVKQLYPYLPRAAHIGFVGVNRLGHPLFGPLSYRIAQLEQMNAPEMNQRALRYKDIELLDTATPASDVETLQLVMPPLS